MIKVSEFKSCVNEPPRQNGEYLVVRFYRGRCYMALHLDYTVGYGWNTSYSNTDHPIRFDDDAYWAIITQEGEV